MSEHLVSYPATAANCGKCGRKVFNGMDQGRAFKLDAVPLNLHGKIAALKAGRNLFTLEHGYGIMCSIRRDYSADFPCVADHDCTVPDAAHVEVAMIPAVQKKLPRDLIEDAFAPVDMVPPF